MTSFRCKACGAMLDLVDKSSLCTCDYCGLKQTMPKLDDEKKINLFTRANRLKLKNEFDAAESIYENIVSNYPEEAEAYWGLLLCKYGVEYVEDPLTANRIPTCHRTSYESIFDDADFKSALNYADNDSRQLYLDEARKIDVIQNKILEIVKEEKPYDVFICYKESDENKNRTQDSVLAQDIYSFLVKEGLTVFFSKITLEDKLGVDYEPYIFSALSSAKVMLLVTTNTAYVDSVWVKNEWSRFLKLSMNQKEKVLITCYKGIEVEDLPTILSSKQAQDMNKIGAMQDLIRGVMKIVGSTSNEDNGYKNQSNPQVDNIVELGFLDIANSEYSKAENSFRLAIQMDMECVGAYLGLIICCDTKQAYIDKLLAISPTISEDEKKLFNNYNCYNLMNIFITYNVNGAFNDRIKYLLDNYHSDIKKIDEVANVNNLLLYAISKNDTEAIKLLVKYGYDINGMYKTYTKGKLDKNQMMPLSYSIHYSNFDTTKFLLEIGANPNSYRLLDQDNGYAQFSVLGDSIWSKKSVRYMKLFIKFGADVNIMEKHVERNKHDRFDTMLSLVVDFNRNIEMLKLLLESGADPNLRPTTNDGVKWTILDRTIWEWKNADAIQLLIDYGADVNAFVERDSGRIKLTPMATTIYCDCNLTLNDFKPIFDTLLKNGANWDEIIRIDNKEYTVRKCPFDVINSLTKEYIKYLKKLGWTGSVLNRFMKKHFD